MRRAGGRARGHAQRHGAVVVPPGRRGRRVAQGPQPPIAVGVRREQQHRLGHGRLQPADRVVQRRLDRARSGCRRAASRRLTCTCRPLAAWSANGLAMKVACSPSARAAALIARLSRKAWSAARKGSATWPRLTSSWPGAYSDTALLAGRPWRRAVVARGARGSPRAHRADRGRRPRRARSRHRPPAASRGARPPVRVGLRVKQEELELERARPGSGRAPRSARRRCCSSARGAAKNGRPSASPSPPSTCAPPSRQGTGAKVAGSIRQGRSASPCSHTSPEASTLAPVASMP